MYDHFTIFVRMFLYGFAALIIGLTRLTGIPDREDSADFYCLLLGAALGMALMASANHLLMVFIAIEMASLPSYALAGFQKGRRASSEVKKLALRHVSELDRKIAELTAIRNTISTLAAQCHGDHRPECPILDDLGGALH